MGRTSIDGLAVRSSGSKPVSAASSRRVVGDVVVPARRRTAPRAERHTRDNTTDNSNIQSTSRSSAALEDDFLAPVESFADDPNNSFGAMDEAAWSELLDGFGDSNSKRSDDLGLQRHNTNTEQPSERRRRQTQNIDETEKPQPSRRERKKQKLPKKRRFKIKHPILLTIMIVLVSLGVTGFVWGDSLISRLTNGKSGIFSAIGAMISNEIPFETDEHGRTNVLVFGTEGYNMSGAMDYVDRDDADGVHDGANLTDSIMVISFDQETQDVAMISIPRDLKVSMACSVGKINEVYWCHNRNGDDEEAGALALATQLSEVLGIEFQYWAHVNWGALADIIDTIGGITVTLNEDINDKYYTGTVIEADVPTRLTGLQAVALARARHGTLGGDFTRGNSQQKIMEGIVNELTTNGVNLTEAFSLMNILGDNFRSNFSTDNIKAGVKMISAFNPTLMRNILLVDYINNVYYMTTATINGISYVVPQAGAGNYTAIHQYMDQILSSNPAVREGAQVAVYNGTETTGVAAGEQGKLEADGFVVSGIGDTDTGSCAEKYCVYALTDNMPATQAALAERYGVEIRSASELPADIYPGVANFVVVVGQAETE